MNFVESLKKKTNSKTRLHFSKNSSDALIITIIQLFILMHFHKLSNLSPVTLIRKMFYECVFQVVPGENVWYSADGSVSISGTFTLVKISFDAKCMFQQKNCLCIYIFVFHLNRNSTCYIRMNCLQKLIIHVQEKEIVRGERQTAKETQKKRVSAGKQEREWERDG